MTPEVKIELARLAAAYVGGGFLWSGLCLLITLCNPEYNKARPIGMVLGTAANFFFWPISLGLAAGKEIVKCLQSKTQ